MESTFQFKTQTIFEHGMSVNRYYHDLLYNLNNRKDSLPIPELLYLEWDKIKPLVYSNGIMNVYQIYHDCGKPYCEVLDSEGRKHFPGHSEKSYQVFKDAFNYIPNEMLETVSNLIRYDMVFHEKPLNEIENFISKNDKRFLVSLYLTNLAELYSNAQMFGGYDSTSFKIKYKKLEKIFKKLYNYITKEIN